MRVEKLNSRRMLFVTFLVISSGFIAWFPSIIANFGNINMNYEVSQIFTVTLFYSNCVSDPVIYILGYPSVKRYLRTITLRRKLSTNSTVAVMNGADTRCYNPNITISMARSETDIPRAVGRTSIRSSSVRSMAEVSSRQEDSSGRCNVRRDVQPTHNDVIEMECFKSCTVLTNCADKMC